MTIKIIHLTKDDVSLLQSIDRMFGEVFDDEVSYSSNKPSTSYLQELLGSTNFISLAAVEGTKTVGAITAYELKKFEQQRSEIYIYDLAVAESVRRQGIATALIAEVRRIATDVGAWVVYIQADHGDPPAETLYTRLGNREEVLHFDLMPLPRDHPG